MSEQTKTRPVGRPLKFESVEVLQTAIDAYFAECDNRLVDVITKDGTVVKVKRQRPYTVSGLAYALDCSRETLLNYEDNENFFGTIKKAKDKCLGWVESQLFEGGAPPAGVIFNLKNNYGWVDKTEVDSKVAADITSKGEKVATTDLDTIMATLKAGTAAKAQAVDNPAS